MTIPRILSIAGSDSGGGAGIQADIKTITMLGGHAMTAITALTAQNTLGVTQVMPVSAEMVIAQIDACISDIGVDAVKIGMIGSAEVAEAVASYFMEEYALRLMPPIVFDPVMVATSGALLADKRAIEQFERLIWLSHLTTPNLPEMRVLAGEGDDLDLVAKARVISDRTGTAFLIKGGHGDGEEIVDRLVGANGWMREWRSDRIDTPHTHGTGCTLSSAIATGLGAGLELEAAVEQGRAFVRASLLAAPGLGQGHGPMGQGLVDPKFRSP